jgi:hypothetical protein
VSDFFFAHCIFDLLLIFLFLGTNKRTLVFQKFVNMFCSENQWNNKQCTFWSNTCFMISFSSIFSSAIEITCLLFRRISDSTHINEKVHITFIFGLGLMDPFLDKKKSIKFFASKTFSFFAQLYLFISIVTNFFYNAQKKNIHTNFE